jgi:hypothetical protein
MGCCITDSLSGIKYITSCEDKKALVFLGGPKFDIYFRYFEIPKKLNKLPKSQLFHITTSKHEFHE